MADLMVPVTVVGGGPVGLSTALELEHHGIPVLLIEPRVEVEHTRPRAKTTSARTMEHFRRWGVAHQLRSVAPLPADWSQRVTFVRNLVGQKITHLDHCLGLSTSPDVSPETAQQVSQGLVEEVLRAAVAERPLITTRFGWKALEVEQSSEHVIVTALTPDQDTVQIRSEWVVGADGARSVVRRAMGVDFEGAAGGKPNVNITFRSEQLDQLIPHAPSIHYWVLDPQNPGVVGPLDTDGTWWAISTGTESIDSDVEAKRIVRGLIGAEIDVNVLATDPWQARLLLAENYRDRRLFIVGDAAHQNPPWGGHGFNTGVGDAVNLGWKLAAVIQGWGCDALLDSYNDERRPIAARTIDIAKTNMQSLSTDLSFSADLDELTPNEHADLADHVRQQKSAEFYADGLIFGYQYQSSTVVADPGTYHPSTAPGSRLPHLTLDSQPIYDLLGPQFTAIGPKRKLVGLLEVAEQTGIPLHLVEHGSDVMLVRPDQHIAWSGSKVSDPHQIMRAALNESSPTGSHKTRANIHSITENAELRTLSNAS